MNSRTVLTDSAAAIVVTCCVVVTVLAVKGASHQPSASFADEREAPGRLVPIPKWEVIDRGGHVLWGPPAALDTLVEFADFQCPYCRAFAVGLEQSLKSEFSGEILFVYRHWPLPYHRLALAAAEAAECAGRQGHFASMHDLLFEKQDSLGLKSFEDFARDAGVPELHSFAVCTKSAWVDSVISADSSSAYRAGGSGTPTFVLDGSRITGGLPDSARLTSLLRQAIRHHASS